MAVDFTNGSYDIGTGLSGPTTLSVFMWIYPTQASGSFVHLFCYDGSSPNNGWGYALGVNARRMAYWSDNVGTWQNSTTDVNQNVWSHVGFVITGTGADGGTHYLNNATDGTWTQTHPDAYTGAEHVLGNSLDGYLAEVGIWDVALTTSDIDILYNGYSPLFVKPNNLIRYWPLVNQNDTERMAGAITATNDTLVDVAHRPIIYPTTPMIGHNSAGAPPAGGGAGGGGTARRLLMGVG